MNQNISTLKFRSKINKDNIGANRINTNWVLKPFPSIINAPYGKKRMTVIVLRGTLLLTLSLAILLIVNGLLVEKIQVTRIVISVVIAMYLILAEILVFHKKFLMAAWMLIILYSGIATLVLLTWSLNASIGILTIGFTVFLAGTLLGTRYISFVTIGTIFILYTIQSIHYLNVLTPDLTPPVQTITFYRCISLLNNYQYLRTYILARREANRALYSTSTKGRKKNKSRKNKSCKKAKRAIYSLKTNATTRNGKPL